MSLLSLFSVCSPLNSTDPGSQGPSNITYNPAFFLIAQTDCSFLELTALWSNHWATCSQVPYVIVWILCLSPVTHLSQFFPPNCELCENTDHNLTMTITNQHFSGSVSPLASDYLSNICLVILGGSLGHLLCTSDKTSWLSSAQSHPLLHGPPQHWHLWGALLTLPSTIAPGLHTHSMEHCCWISRMLWSIQSILSHEAAHPLSHALILVEFTSPVATIARSCLCCYCGGVILLWPHEGQREESYNFLLNKISCILLL